MRPELVQLVTGRMSALNRDIKDDPLLGENYQIGHSYFTPPGEEFSRLDEEWYRTIVRTEIVPLLREYWFDNPHKAQEIEERLLA
jgi:5-methylcytosine-specific restriction protein B